MSKRNVSSLSEERFNKAAAKFEALLLRAVGEAVIATDLEGTVLLWNDAAQALYGWASEEALGQNIIDITPTLDNPPLAAEILQKLSEGERWSGQFETRHKDGGCFAVEVTNSPVLDEQGSLIAIVGVSRLASGQNNKRLARQVNQASALYRLLDRLYRGRTLDDVYNAALDAIAETLDCNRASILLFDETGIMRFVASRGLSEQYRRAVDGHSPWKPGAQNPQPIFVSDIEETDEPEWLKGTIRREGIRALAFIPLMVKGSVAGKFMTYYNNPHHFDSDQIDLAITISRQVGFSLEMDRSDKARRQAELETKESEERFRLMSEHAPVMIWMSDARGACLHLNQALRQFWGIKEAQVATFNWAETLHPDDLSRVTDIITTALLNRSVASISGRYRRADGEFRVLQTEARPRFAASGTFLGMIGVNVDMTERERAEAHRDLLIAELNHRVKNTLAIVQGIAYQTFRGATTSPDAKAAFEGRLLALARAHDLLTRSNWENGSLEHLAADAVATLGTDSHRISYSGPPILLPPPQAVAIGLALHELLTNAAKYGALSNEVGTVDLTWSVLDPEQQQFDIVWRERGGPPVAEPTREGFGSVLLKRMFSGELHGQVRRDFHPDGLVCVIQASVLSSRTRTLTPPNSPPAP